MSDNVSRETGATAPARHLPASSCVYSFSPHHPPALAVDAGEIVVLQTADCFSGQIRDRRTLVPDIDRTRANPATGPVYVHGAQPGDTLAVEILDLQPEDTGLMVTTPGMGLLGDDISESRTHMVRIADGSARLGSLTFQVQPMLGVIGVAPAEGSAPTIVPGPHGGNLDVLLVAKGSTIYLPVSHPGALFGAGDMHAAMGDGEISGTGIETGGSARLRLTVIRDLPISWPWLQTPRSWAVMVSGTDLQEIARLASRQMIAFLMQRLDCDFPDAYMICGSSMRLAFCQVVNPRYTVRAEIPKHFIG